MYVVHHGIQGVLTKLLKVINLVHLNYVESLCKDFREFVRVHHGIQGAQPQIRKSYDTVILKSSNVLGR